MVFEYTLWEYQLFGKSKPRNIPSTTTEEGIEIKAKTFVLKLNL